MFRSRPVVSACQTTKGTAEGTATPMVSVVIPTCNRPHCIETCLKSLMQVNYPRWEILVIDQSKDVLTEDVVRDYQSAFPPIHYRHLDQRGASRARNLGMRLAQSDIIAFIDDDCWAVGSDWLHRITDAFVRHPEASLIFGSARAAAHDSHQSWIYSYEVSAERVLRGRMDFTKFGGGAGSMYLCMSRSRNVGPMDVHAGPGAEFPSAEDREYAYRHLAAGNTVVETPNIVVEHHGARDFESGAVSSTARLAAISQGAIEVKFVRCGDLAAALLILRHIAINLAQINPVALITRRRPSNLGWFVMYLYGVFIGLKPRLMRDHKLWGRLEDYHQGQLVSTATLVVPPTRSEAESKAS